MRFAYNHRIQLRDLFTPDGAHCPETPPEKALRRSGVAWSVLVLELEEVSPVFFEVFVLVVMEDLLPVLSFLTDWELLDMFRCLGACGIDSRWCDEARL